jgi:hypothetical protein
MALTEEEMKIAEWMLDEFSKHQRLSQSTAARGIRQNHGDEHVYKNKQLNLACTESYKPCRHTYGPLIRTFRFAHWNGLKLASYPNVCNQNHNLAGKASRLAHFNP